MTVGFGGEKAEFFRRLFTKDPKTLTRNCYLNFLRFYRHNNNFGGLKRILGKGAQAWRKLMAEDQDVLGRSNRDNHDNRNLHKFRYNKPLGGFKRSMNGERSAPHILKSCLKSKKCLQKVSHVMRIESRNGASCSRNCKSLGGVDDMLLDEMYMARSCYADEHENARKVQQMKFQQFKRDKGSDDDDCVYFLSNIN